MTLDGDSVGVENGVDEESTPLLFPSIRPTLSYKDLQGHHYGSTPYSNDDVGFRQKSSFSSALKEAVFKPFRNGRRSCRRYIGILLAIFASFLLSLTTLIARVLIEYHPFNEAMWRFMGILLPSIPILLWNNCSTKDKMDANVSSCCSGDKLKTFFVIFVSLFYRQIQLK